MRESIVSLTNVRQPAVIEQNLLKDECGDGFRQFAAALHDSQAQRNDFRSEQKRYNFLFVSLYQCSNHSKAGKTQVFKRSGFG